MRKCITVSHLSSCASFFCVFGKKTPQQTKHPHYPVVVFTHVAYIGFVPLLFLLFLPSLNIDFLYTLIVKPSSRLVNRQQSTYCCLNINRAQDNSTAQHSTAQPMYMYDGTCTCSYTGLDLDLDLDKPCPACCACMMLMLMYPMRCWLSPHITPDSYL